MQMSFALGYSIFSIILAGIDLYVAYLANRNKNAIGRRMRNTLLLAAVADLTYMVSVVTTGLMLTKVMLSICFVAIDFTLISLIDTAAHATRDKRKGASAKEMTFRKVGIVFCVIDASIFAVNIFYPIAVEFKPKDSTFVHFAFTMKPPAYIHLGVTYILILTTIMLMLRKVLRAPYQFKGQNLLGVFVILTLVAVNAVFISVPSEHMISHVDISVAGYSIACVACYWGWFEYTKTTMSKNLSLHIFNSIGQGILLFDYEKRLIMHNMNASFLLGTAMLREEMTIEDLEKMCSIRINREFRRKSCSIQCYIGATPLRCDFRCLRNRQEQVIGYLYAFTDAALETDLLTGFRSWEAFSRQYDLENLELGTMASVAVFDLNNLTLTNNTFGRESGDKMIRSLADVLRTVFPQESYFIRGTDANLIVVTPGLNSARMGKLTEKVAETATDHYQSAVMSLSESQNDIMAAIADALDAVRYKKLVDTSTAHSNALSSLVRALKESDNTTEAHVQRTREMGAELGRRLGLSDMQLSQLSLLCLLHDIGKIGIPVEILNKPGRLNAAEWKVMKAHTTKGYQIAMSSVELMGIADTILHHHECWDGSGYPDGLSRESIPFLSRIISIVDAYDAMVYERPYHKPISSQQALDELKRCAGTQFDPRIVSEFIWMVMEQKDDQEINVTTGRDEKKKDEEAAPKKSAPVDQNTHAIVYARYVLDMDKQILEIDNEFTQLTGYTRDDIDSSKGLNQMDLIPQEDRAEYLVMLASILSKNSSAYLEHRLQMKNGEIRYVVCYGRQYYDSAAVSGRSEIIIYDMMETHVSKLMQRSENTKAKKQREQWEQTYRRDSLTELLSHAAFQNDIEDQLLKEQVQTMMIMIDVDHFKEYNDTYGHASGDEMLIMIAQALKSSLHEGELACRMGGDEFAAAIFFPLDRELEVMRMRATEIFDRTSIALRKLDNSVSLSMGMAVTGENCRTFKELYKKADKALYRAKDDGRSQICLEGES